MYAIIAEGGRQYKVTSGDVIRIDRPLDSLGDAKTVTFDQVLMVGGEGQPKIGTPLVAAASVSAEVIRPVKGPKVDIIKYKRRKGFHKHIGHRQKQLEVRITEIKA
jgi:large subunit ribosomal protein L21